MRGRTVALVGEGGRNGVVTLEGEGVRSAGTREGECVGEGRAFLGEEGGGFLAVEEGVAFFGEGTALLGEEGRALLGEEGIAFLGEEGRALLGEEGIAFLGEEGRALLGEEGIAFLVEVVVTECVIGCTPTLNTKNQCNMTEATPLSLWDLHFHSVDLRIICGFHPHPPLQSPLFLVST